LGTAISLIYSLGTRFAVAGTHLDLVAEPRLRHVHEMDRAIAQHVPPEVPTIVGGDINDQPGSPVWDALCARRQDAFALAGSGDGFTSSAIDARRRIDALFVDPGVRVTGARVIDGPDVLVATDHRPLLVELEL
ncbi:MAG: endonuclease/exonuclease/phosphatase family protein, partial [Jatrophihabitantaceae bacterium]